MIKFFLYPNISIHNKDNLFPLAKMLTQEHNDLDCYYKIVDDINDCDFILNPEIINIKFKKSSNVSIHHIIKKAKEAKKKVVCFTSGDFGKTIYSDKIIMIRMGGFKSKMKTENFISAYVTDPYLLLKESFSIIKKKEKPTIGFVGHSNGSLIKLAKEFLLFIKKNSLLFLGKEYHDYQEFYPSSYFRNKYLKVLKQEKSLISDFVFRKKYRAGADDEITKQKTSVEFYNNIKNNLYTFCLRGSGNFSIRFYETLAMGRIPVLIDTDCKLPFDDVIDWKKHAIIIPEKKYKLTADYILDFHKKKSELELEQIQNSNRKLWENYFTRNSFYTQLAISLEKLINNN
jgi:Exostosin family